MLASVCGVAAGPAAAFDLFGIHLWGKRKPQKLSPDAQPYKIHLHIHTADQGLVDKVRAASDLWSQRKDKPPPSTAVFLGRARGEYAHIVDALRAAGYYGGTVAVYLDGQKLENFGNDAVLPRPAAVEITVDSGPQFRFGVISIANRPPAEPDSVPVFKTPEQMGLISGQVARADIVLQVEQSLLMGWKRHGHPKPVLLPPTIIARHDTNRLDVALAVDPGPALNFGAVTITGNRRMNAAFIARQTVITPGTPWDQRKMDEALRRLRLLQVFSSITLTPDKTPGPGGTLGVTVRVAERPLRSFGADASYSTLDGLGLGVNWQYRNLFGDADRLRLDARVDNFDSTSANKLSYLTSATLTQPGTLSPYTDQISEIYMKREAPETYTQQSVGAQFGYANEINAQWHGNIMANIEFDHVDDAFGTRDLEFLSLPSQLLYDGSNDKLEPSAGLRFKLSLEPFYEFHFGNAGLISRIDTSTYQALDSAHDYIVAGRLALGSIVGAPADEMPPDRLFYAGGGQSVRGYAYRSLGPIGTNGEVDGGSSLFESSLELRMKITDQIGIVPFVDAGAAYRDDVPDFSQTMRFGAGLGGRYYTSIGALRVDVAVPVNPRPGDAGFALYLGLGESF